MKPYRYPKPCFITKDNAIGFIPNNPCIVVETDNNRFYITIDEWANQGGE